MSMRTGAAPNLRSASGVPIAGCVKRELTQVIIDLVAVRPVNWEDSKDPQQRAAWQAADAALARMGIR